MLKYISIMALMLLAGFTCSTYAELTIEITRGVDNPTVIAISPISMGGAALSEDISKIVSTDLKHSGLFKPVDRKNMLAFPRSANEVYYRDWRILGVQYLVYGRVEHLDADRIKIFFGLNEVLGEKTVFSHVVNGSSKHLRDVAHYISDKVYEAITGTPGIFSTRIAYITATPMRGNELIYKLMVSDADGARERMLLESTEPLMSPGWSPDGSELVYVSFETGRPAIFRQRLSDASRKQLTNFRGLNGAPSWSPDGKKLALVLSKDGNPEIYTFELESGEFTRLTRHFSIDTEPNWSPDGKSIIFTSDRGGTPQIYKISIANKAIERITFRGSYNARPRLAPDGRTLVMVHRENGQYHIASQDLINNDFRILTGTYLDESPTVAPNGAMLLYATKRGNKGLLAAVSIDSGVKFFLPSRKGDVREPAWSPFL